MGPSKKSWTLAALSSLALLLGVALSGCDSDLSSGASSAAPAADIAEAPPEARLPAGVAPEHYRLHLTIDPRQDTFSGSAEIAISLTEQTPLIWLHGKSLAVSSAQAVAPDGTITVLHWQQHTDFGVASLQADAPLPAGKLTLEIEYDAPFDTNLDGLYKVVEAENAYAFTQFESTSARLAFPSFDEPAFKVTFDISMTVPEQFTGITNTPQTGQTRDGNGYKTMAFATSKPLPTYLIAFAVGSFDVVEWDAIPASAHRQAPIPLRGITIEGKGDQIHYALENTEAIVLDMEDYFDTAYPYAKLDIIAVPDFRSGAMENAGAITYREQLLLLNEDSSVRQKRGFLSTHAHELAHQWFGNLVTPVWWDDIWLNESFATWNSSAILDRLYPEENYRESRISSSHRVMRSDSLASARQIREPITRHADIGSAFNGITYQKGGGVLTMFEAFLGRDNFRNGIRAYMKKHAFGNTTAEDFISAIADANPQVDGQDLRDAFNSFIEQAGMPTLAVTQVCDDTGAQLEVSQKRYLPTGSTGNSDQTWLVPACVNLWPDEQQQSQCFLLKNQQETIDLNTESCLPAVMPNTGGSSYYRWSMNPEQWQALLQRFDSLSSGEQISVASSLSAALNDGSLPLSDYLAGVSTLATAQSYRVAMAPRGDLQKVYEFVLTADEKTGMEQKLKYWYQPRLDEFEGKGNLTPDQQEFHSQLLSTLALDAKDPALRARLTEQAVTFTGFGGDQQLRPEAIDPNIRLLALFVAVEEKGADFAQLLWQQFLSAEDALLRDHLLRGMASSIDPEVAALSRERILSSSIRDNEIFNILWYQMSNEENRQSMWEWTMENLDAVLARIPSQNRGGLTRVFSRFCDAASADDLEARFSSIIESLESGPRHLANTVESVRLCAAFVDFQQANTGE